jgi:hypothetical protein
MFVNSIIKGIFNFGQWMQMLMKLLECFNIASPHPFLFFLTLICLGIFNGNMFQTFGDSLLDSCILTSLREGKSKTSPLKTLHHTQNFTMCY